MTQRPIGEVVLRTKRGEEIVPLEQENLYVRTIQAFAASIRGEGQPSCTGEDGLRSLATALAALESARTGRRVAVHLGGDRAGGYPASGDELLRGGMEQDRVRE